MTIIDIFIIAIIILGIIVCFKLAVRETTHKKQSKVIEIFITIILTLVLSLAAAYAGEKLGTPTFAFAKIIYSMGIPLPTSYTNPTFKLRTSEIYNYQIEYPTHFKIDKGAGDSEEDFHLKSPDRKADLIFTAKLVDGDKLPESFTINHFRRTYEGTDDYSVDRMDDEGWYVVSTRTRDGMHHYCKCIFTQGVVRMFTFSYPLDQEEIYLDLFDYDKHFEKSFRKLY